MARLQDLEQAARSLAERGDDAAAIPIWQQILAQNPDHPIALLSVGDAARRQGDGEKAETLLRHAVRVAPRLVPARCALANLLLYSGREDEAGTLLEQASSLSPSTPYVWRDLGLWHRVNGRPAAALEAFDRALALSPNDAAAALGRSLCLLRLGRWAEGFAAYHHRWSVAGRPPRHGTIPQWRGEGDLAGKRLLVWDEQGAGDTIMCARLIQPLLAAGADVCFECPTALVPLFLDGRFGRPIARGQPLPPMDMQVALLDLPGLLGLTPQTIPWHGPYLAADPAQLESWGRRLPRQGNRPRIGISWAGNPAHPGDRWRTPGLEALLPLLERSGIDWYALQVASGRDQLDATPLPAHVTDLGPGITGWGDSAAILTHLDLLITPDSALCHLAGAMGRPVWTLISTDTDWRWLEDGNRTGWYPSMRLFRQKSRGDWAGLLSRLIPALPT